MCSSETFPPRPKKSVCFGSVHVREHPIILGDNPSCSSGPPLALSWYHDSSLSLTFDLEEWESGRRLVRRAPHEIRVPASVRTEWILDAGYSPLQVHRAVRAVEGERRRRRLGLKKLLLQNRAGIMTECLKRKFKRAISRGRRSGKSASRFLFKK